MSKGVQRSNSNCVGCQEPFLIIFIKRAFLIEFWWSAIFWKVSRDCKICGLFVVCQNKNKTDCKISKLFCSLITTKKENVIQRERLKGLWKQNPGCKLSKICKFYRYDVKKNVAMLR